MDDEVATTKSMEEDTSDWKDIHAKVEEELAQDELSLEATSTESPEAAVEDVALDDGETESSPDALHPPDLRTLPVQDKTEEGSEQSAAPIVDEVDEEENEDEDEDEEVEENEEEDVEEESEEEDQEEEHDADEKNCVEGSEENNASTTVAEEELVYDGGEATLRENTIEEFTTGETASSEDASKVPQTELEQDASGLIQDESPIEADVEGQGAGKVRKGTERADDKEVQYNPLIAMTLTIRNKVNDKYVVRPEKLGESDQWTVEYSLAEIQSASRAWSLYGACQNRRKKKLDDEELSEEDIARNYYLRRMRELSDQGRTWRNKQDQIEMRTAKVVLDQPNAPSQTRADDSSGWWASI